MSFSVRLYSRATPEEYAAICANAKTTGLSPSRYLAEAGAGKRLVPAKPKTDQAMLSEINRIGGLVFLIKENGETALAEENRSAP